MNNTFDEKYGTDYEGKIHLGGRYFHPLNEYITLSPEARSILIRFQATMPEDAYGFLYVPSHIIKVMLNNETDHVLGKWTYGDGARLTILVVLGDKLYERRRYDLSEINDIERLNNINHRFEHTQIIVTQILEAGKKILGRLRDNPLELLILHRDTIDALLTPFFIMESLGNSDPKSEGGEGQFYRLR